MNIYVSSDESGVFDHLHNNNYVFGGTIVLGAESLDDWRRRYSKAEKDVRNATHQTGELKATNLENKYKYKLFRSLNGCFKFAVIIKQQLLHKNIWDSKKDKQRYLDYAYKIAVKRALKNLMDKGKLNPDEVENIYLSRV